MPLCALCLGIGIESGLVRKAREDKKVKLLARSYRMPGAMDDLNPADFSVLQPDLDPVRVKPGLREKVLDDASGQFPCGLVLFEDD